MKCLPCTADTNDKLKLTFAMNTAHSCICKKSSKELEINKRDTMM